MEFVIGGLAGAGATIFTNPMDVVKTRLQLQGELGARIDQHAQYKGVFHAFRVITRAEGALALQKGLIPAMLFGFTMNSVRLGLYHVADLKGLTKHSGGSVSFNKAVFWGAVSGYLSGILSNPMSVVKTRIQAAAHPSIAVGRQHIYTGMTHAFVTIYKTEGVKSFFAGVSASCTRIAMGSAAQLTSFAFAKEALLNKGICEHSPFGLAFYASSISGVAVCCGICPLEVITVRLYNQGKAKNGVVYSLFEIYRTEGLHGLYRGVGPLYLRIAPHTTISLVIWDVLKDILLNKNKTQTHPTPRYL